MPVQSLHIPIDTSSTSGNSDPRSKLRKLLDEKEEFAVKRAEIAQTELMTAEAEREKRRLETDMADAGSGKHNHEHPRNEEEDRQKTIAQAVTLLNAGVDPRIVGQILAGSTPIAPITMPQPTHNGDAMMKTLKDLVVLITGVKRDAEVEHLKEKLDKLDQDLKDERSGRKRRSEDEHSNIVVNPLKVAADAAQSVGFLYKTFRDIGLIKEPVPATGTDLEVVKETHRHNERIRELELEETRKNGRADMITSGIEKFGKAMAEVVRTRGDTKTNIQTFKCTCGADLPVIPEATEITCPRCSNVYARAKREVGNATANMGENTSIQPDQPRADNSSGVQLSE